MISNSKFLVSSKKLFFGLLLVFVFFLQPVFGTCDMDIDSYAVSLNGDDSIGATCKLTVRTCSLEYAQAVNRRITKSTEVGQNGEALVQCILQNLRNRPNFSQQEGYDIIQAAHSLDLSMMGRGNSLTLSYPAGETERIVDFRVQLRSGIIGIEVKNIQQFRNDYYEQIAKDFLLVKSRNLNAYAWFFINRSGRRNDYEGYIDNLLAFLDSTNDPDLEVAITPGSGSKRKKPSPRINRSNFFTFILVDINPAHNQVQLEILR